MGLFSRKQKVKVIEKEFIISQKYSSDMSLNKIDGNQLIMNINNTKGMIGNARLSFDRKFIPPNKDFIIRGRIMIEIEAIQL